MNEPEGLVRTVVCESKKHKIIRERFEEGEGLCVRTFRNGNRQHAKIVSDAFYVLKERRWFFCHYWVAAGFTNSKVIAMEWVNEFIKGKGETK
jgi:hypothetical protein